MPFIGSLLQIILRLRRCCAMIITASLRRGDVASTTQRAHPMKKQTVLVTGAASGIGRACARKLLDEEHDVVALDLKQEALAAALPEDFGHLLRFAGDVSRHECCTGAIAAAIARFGKLDAVTHWAAMHSDIGHD
ncbi:MAG: hypothetical protein A3G26_07210 [Betaproteobacteria bacterium RIFCSPLOWO2_12_FULL_65_110]|nr:MAG: hypothetical protein A3G26_07210 [Betaproteobacteria bacterium RIFCSPLOWO2_12_FULL_65_110]